MKTAVENTPVKELQTKIINSLHGWKGETIRTEKDRSFNIYTMKTSSGTVNTIANEVKASKNKNFLIMEYSDIMKGPFFRYNHGKIRATEKTIKDAHFYGLSLFDEKINGEEYIKATAEIYTPKIGDILFLDGYDGYKGSHENNFIIYKIEGRNYHTIEKDTLELRVKDYVKDYKNKFGIGIYFEEGHNMQKYGLTQNDLNNMLIEAPAAAKRREEAIKRAIEIQNQEDEQTRKELLKKFDYLTPLTDRYNDNGKKTNLRTCLKKHFEGVKFSVTNPHGDTIYIKWTDGPTTEEVERITNKYTSYENDVTGDYRDYNPSIFNNLFGGFKYVFTTRENTLNTPEIKKEFIQLLDLANDYDGDSYFYRFINKQVIKANQKFLRFERIENFSGSLEDSVKIIFEDQEVKEAPTHTQTETTVGEVTIIQYSDKSIAVIGDTKPIKDDLKALGGRFNFRLTCGAGWIFQKTKEAEVKRFLNL